MLDSLFTGIFGASATIAFTDFLFCMGASLGVGLLLAAGYTYRNTYSKSFVVTLAMLPAIVCVIIMMVSGSIGAGVAVAGTFSLVRFRSVPGTAKEICAIFLAMAAGLATGMGYLGFALTFSVIMTAVSLFYTATGFGEGKNAALRKTMRVTIPEDLDYTDVFDDLFDQYTHRCELVGVKTTNMGSLFRLTYDLTLRSGGQEKEFIDKLRCRNGNLEISSSRQSSTPGEL